MSFYFNFKVFYFLFLNFISNIGSEMIVLVNSTTATYTIEQDIISSSLSIEREWLCITCAHGRVNLSQREREWRRERFPASPIGPNLCSKVQSPTSAQMREGDAYAITLILQLASCVIILNIDILRNKFFFNYSILENSRNDLEIILADFQSWKIDFCMSFLLCFFYPKVSPIISYQSIEILKSIMLISLNKCSAIYKFEIKLWSSDT